LFGGTFVLIVFVVLGLAYYIYVGKVFLPLTHRDPHSEDSGAKFILAGFHLLLTLQLWSLIKTMMTDPGVVPPYWGFYIGDAESKRKRYCLMCHVFKPERCHHCSICNRCVLNMDHHCRKR
jgi:palmitoyltransferase